MLAARGAELEHQLAFGVVRQLFEARVARAPQADREELLAGAAALAAPVTGAPLAPGLDPLFGALHGLHWLTVNLAARGPLLLVVDDAQWADAPSLRFLSYLAGRLAGVPAVAAVGTRVSEPGADTALLDAVLGDPHATVAHPAPLSPAAVSALVADRMGGAADGEFMAACASVTGGNPFLVVELATALAADGLAPTEASVEQVRALGPATVGRSVLARLARMDPECAQLARAVAVLGEDADLDAAAGLAGLDSASAARAADALAAAEVFRRDRRPAFAHPMVRAAIYEDILPQERAAAHLRAARALSGADPAVVGAHLLLAPRAGDPWVVGRAAAGGRRRPRRRRARECRRVARAGARRAAAARAADRARARARARRVGCGPSAGVRAPRRGARRDAGTGRPRADRARSRPGAAHDREPGRRGLDAPGGRGGPRRGPGSGDPPRGRGDRRRARARRGARGSARAPVGAARAGRARQRCRAPRARRTGLRGCDRGRAGRRGRPVGRGGVRRRAAAGRGRAGITERDHGRERAHVLRPL